jgi:DNA-binding transcriptional MerR regulator
VAADTGLTTRSIRYYEEIGLLRPAARSGGAYRLYDGDDLERLRFIKGLRDDAGFSLAEISQLLEDEDARARNRERIRSSTDPAERQAALADTLARLDRRVQTLRDKIERLETMVGETDEHRSRVQGRLDEVERELAAERRSAKSKSGRAGVGR